MSEKPAKAYKMAVLLLICYPPSWKGGLFIYISVYYSCIQKKHNASFWYVLGRVFSIRLQIHGFFCKVGLYSDVLICILFIKSGFTLELPGWYLLFAGFFCDLPNSWYNITSRFFSLPPTLFLTMTDADMSGNSSPEEEPRCYD